MEFEPFSLPLLSTFSIEQVYRLELQWHRIPNYICLSIDGWFKCPRHSQKHLCGIFGSSLAVDWNNMSFGVFMMAVNLSNNFLSIHLFLFSFVFPRLFNKRNYFGLVLMVVTNHLPKTGPDFYNSIHNTYFERASHMNIRCGISARVKFRQKVKNMSAE